MMAAECASGAKLNSTITEKAIGGSAVMFAINRTGIRKREKKGRLQMGKAKILGMNKTYVPNNRDRKRNPFSKKKVKK